MKRCNQWFRALVVLWTLGCMAYSRSLGDQPGTLKWRVQLPVRSIEGENTVGASALAADGTLYQVVPKASVGGIFDTTVEGYVLALESRTGAVKWRFTTRSTGGAAALGTNGWVYVGTFGGVLFALDGATGAPHWTFQAPEAGSLVGGFSAVSIGPDGVVYANGGPRESVYAVDGATGRLNWSFLCGAQPAMGSSPAIGTNGLVYAGANAGKVYALVAANGEMQWEFTAGGSIRSSPALGSDGTVYVGCDDGKVYALDGATGGPRWTFNAGVGIVSSPAVDASGTVYVGAPDRRFYALAGATGRPIWTNQGGGGVYTAPALAADGTVYFTASDGCLHALDGALGRQKWEKATPWFWASPTVGGDGTVYVGSDAFSGSAPLADAPWAKFHQGLENRASAPSPGAAPSIVRAPAGVVALAGAEVTLSVLAEGSAPLRYQWFQDGLPLANATGAVYRVPAMGLGNLGQYSVLVANPYGVARSEPVPLNLAYRLTLAIQGGGEVVREPELDLYPRGSTVVLTATPKAPRGFVGWFGDLSGTNRRITYRVEGDMTLQARFEALPGDLLWRLDASGYPAVGAPALGTNGSLYVGSRESGAQYLHSVDGTDGRTRWRFRLNGGLTAMPAIADDGTVFLADAPNLVRAVDGDTGVQRWVSTVNGGSGLSGLALDADGTVYACGGDLSALDPNTGAQQWNFTWDAPMRGMCPAVGRDGAIYLGLQDGNLYAVNRAGTFRWKCVTGSSARLMSSPVLGDATVYVGAAASGFQAVNPTDGAVRWSLPAVCPSGASAAALGWDHTVYVASVDGSLYAVDTRSGARKWGFLLSSQPLTSPALAADGTVYVGGQLLYALNSADGSEKWAFDAGHPFVGAPTVGPDGTVYACTDDGALCAVAGSAPLAQTAWPKDRRDLANSGRGPAAEEVPPALVTQLQGRLVKQGDAVSLSVQAQGSEPLSYLWCFQGRPLSNEHSATLTLPSFEAGLAGEYYAVVGNAFGVVTSAMARLDLGLELNVGANGPGTVVRDPEAALYALGAQVVLRALPDLGHRFLGWAGDLTGTNEYVTVVMDANRRIVARYDVLPGALRWSFATGGPVLSCPALGEGGTVFFGSADGRVYALDSEIGRQEWVFATTGPVLSSPALGHDGTLYVGSADERLYALSATSGASLWEAPMEGPVNASPAVALDGTVYVGTDTGGQFRAFDGATGVLRWSAPVNGGTNSAVLGEDGAVFVVSAGAVVALESDSGAIRWTSSPARQIGTGPILGSNGLLYTGLAPIGAYRVNAAYWGGACAIQLEDGAVRGSFILHAATKVAPPVLGVDGSLYLGLTNYLCAVDSTAQTQRWLFAAGGTIQGAPAVAADGTVYAASVDGWLYALDGDEGTLKWRFQAGGPIRSSPTIGADGTVYFGADDGRLYAVAGTAPLAASPWPNLRGGPRNLGSRQQTGPPVLLAQPGARGAVLGRSVSLRVDASGARPLSYQWYFEGQALAPGTGAVYTVDSFARTDEGRYWVEVTNSAGRTVSESFSLSGGYGLDVSVLGPGKVAREPALEAYPAGTKVILTALADPGATPRPFLGWTGDARGAEARVEVVADRDLAVTARFGFLPSESKWIRDFPGPLRGRPAVGPEGSLYVKASQAPEWQNGERGNQRVYALNPGDGSIRWTYPLRAWVLPDGTERVVDPVVGLDGSVYVSDFDATSADPHSLIALDGVNGARRWTANVGFPAARVLLGIGDTVYATTRQLDFGSAVEGSVWGGYASSGQTLWRRAYAGVPAVGAVDGLGGLLLGSSSGPVYRVEQGSGEIVWQTNLGAETGGNPAIASGGIVCFIQGGSNLVALATATGNRAWERAGAWGKEGAPIIGLGGTFFAAAEGRLIAFDPSQGKTLWQFKPDGATVFGPTLSSDGILHFAASDLRLYAVGAADGDLKWSCDLALGASAELISESTVVSTFLSAVEPSVTLGPDGTAYVVEQMCESTYTWGQYPAFFSGRLHAVQASAGLALAPWPKPNGDARNSGASPLTQMPPHIIEQPQAAKVAVGRSATLRVTAMGVNSLVYQWYRGASGDTATPVAAGNGRVLVTPELVADASFWVRVSNSSGHTDSEAAAVTVLPEGAFPVLRAVRVRPGAIRLQFGGLPGSRWRVEHSDDLLAWTPYAQTLTVQESEVSFSIPVPTSGRRFFRVVEAP